MVGADPGIGTGTSGEKQNLRDPEEGEELEEFRGVRGEKRVAVH